MSKGLSSHYMDGISTGHWVKSETCPFESQKKVQIQKEHQGSI
jgi:hypothetical protein